jgi:hypothetical protein
VDRTPGPDGLTERGTAIVGTLVGFLIFMTLLLLGVQRLVHLYATSALTSAADDAATQVATAGGAPSAVPGAEVATGGGSPSGIPGAQAAARASLGRFGAEHTSFDWIEVDAHRVVLRVTAVSPELLPLSASMDRITRTVSWRTERFGP